MAARRTKDELLISLEDEGFFSFLFNAQVIIACGQVWRKNKRWTATPGTRNNRRKYICLDADPDYNTVRKLFHEWAHQDETIKMAAERWAEKTMAKLKVQ
jgi:hypothetical protein